MKDYFNEFEFAIENYEKIKAKQDNIASKCTNLYYVNAIDCIPSFH